MHTLEIGHVSPHIRIQGVDNHLAVGGTSDLHSPINKTWSWWCAFPCVIVANVLGLWEEVKKVALIKLSLTNHSSLEETFPALVKCAVEEGKEDSGIFAENVTVGVVQLTKDVHLAENTIWVGCHGEVCSLSGLIVGMFKRQGKRNAMMYACGGEGWAAGR